MRENDVILLVEDDKVDAMTVTRAMREIHVVNPLIVVGNGAEALDYLRDSENLRPALILLDLNMPKMNGLEFLKEVRADKNLHDLAILVLTTSQEDRDRVASFKPHVAGYMIKPVDYKQFLETMRTIREYWHLSLSAAYTSQNE